jgi:hypothetical protein
MTTFFVCLGALAALALMGYLAACAGAERWLTLREWLARTSCSHTHGRLVEIEFDGEAVYECADCGKSLRRAL